MFEKNRDRKKISGGEAEGRAGATQSEFAKTSSNFFKDQLSKKLMALYNIRRCLNCNSKTHSRHWRENKIYPICESASGFHEGNHGGLTLEQMRSVKEKILQTVQAIERERT